MQASKKKLVLEHLVVRAAGGRSLAPADLEDIIRYGAAALFSDELRADKPPIADGAAWRLFADLRVFNSASIQSICIHSVAAQDKPPAEWLCCCKS